MKKSFQPIWISHRGIRETGFTENTLAAYELAEKYGFQWLETDLRLTKDDHIVLSHDRSLKRLTGKDLNVDEVTRSELESLNFKCGQSPLFLETFIDRFAHMSWVFDVKSETSARCIEVLRAMLNRRAESQIEEKITFLMWSTEDENLARKLFPLSKFFAQDKECWRAGLAAILGVGWLSGIKPDKAYAVLPKLWGLNLFSRRIFSVYHRRNGHVIAYLPDSHETLLQAVDAGPDFILSDRLIFGQPNS